MFEDVSLILNTKTVSENELYIPVVMKACVVDMATGINIKCYPYIFGNIVIYKLAQMC